MRFAARSERVSFVFSDIVLSGTSFQTQLTTAYIPVAVADVITTAILVPGLPLTAVPVLSQDVDGLILPAILVFMLILINDKRVMGKHANGIFANIVGGVTIGAVIILALALVISTIPGFPWIHV